MLRRFTSLLIMLALATMLGIVVLRLGDSQAISSPTLTLLGGDGGAYFSAETGFNVVPLRLEGVAAGSGETLTARFDGDGYVFLWLDRPGQQRYPRHYRCVK